MLIYIHVPFCRSRCSYCAFYSQPIGRDASVYSDALRDYIDNLMLEIAWYGDRFGKQEVQSVFFGGGTPSLLPPAIIGSIMERINKSFKIGPRAEITLEANPESLAGRKAHDYFASGVNRLSIGVQSLDDATLKMLGRPHKARDAINAIYAARDAGFTNINVDLLWGLPGQSVRQWLSTLKEMTGIGPDHISAYGLTLEPGTEMDRLCENRQLALPPERDQSIMYMEGAAILESKGYLQYEISNFARMGYQCRHNTGYWEGMEYLGLGPSATSTVNGRRWTTPASISAWGAQVQNGALGQGAEILTPKAKVLELIMLRLRTARGLRLKAYRDLTGHDFVQDHQRLVQALHENGLARIRKGYLSLTRSGMLVSNSILGNLFERAQKLIDDDLKPVANTDPIPIPSSEPRALPVIWPQADTKPTS